MSPGSSNSAAGTGTVVQGILLCLLSTLNVAAALLIAPVLPKIVAAFAYDPAVQIKVVAIQAAPALVLALTAALSGRIVDTTGRKGLLLWSLVLYLLCGLAPFFLQNLDLIIASRVGVGLAESGFMTASTTLIGDYFKGKRREHWLVMQTSTASISAIVLAVLGGLMGNYGWRAPFLLYALPLLFIPLVLLLIREPAHDQEEDHAPGFPWAKVLPLYVVALFAAILFMIIPIQTPFLMTGRGFAATSLIGLTSAIGGIAVPVGGFVFKWTPRLSLPQHLGLAFGLIAAGLALFVGDGSFAMMMAGIVITSLGYGIVLPTLLTGIMAKLGFGHRGSGIGWWQTAFFLGQSLSPVVMLVLSQRFGKLETALLIAAGASAFFVVISLVNIAVNNLTRKAA